MVRPPSTRREAISAGFSDFWETVLTAPDPDRLTALGKRLDEAEKRQAAGAQRRRRRKPGSPAVSQPNWLRHWSSEADLGWGIDWLLGHFGFHTRPVFLIVFFVLAQARVFAT
jgi:hypothetical protein